MFTFLQSQQQSLKISPENEETRRDDSSMASESADSESSIRNRPRRSKREPKPVLSDDLTAESSAQAKPTPVKSKPKSILPADFQDNQADLYQPGDIVWCKLGSFPWWPALVCRCETEGGIHTKLINSNNKPKRVFFVYFYGKYLEYSWITTKWLLKYAGLNKFIAYAESAVQEAPTKSEQQELANRYQLKVSVKKRVQWDEAIELADNALSLTNEERIQEFTDLLNEVKDTKSQKRARKSSATENTDEKPPAEPSITAPTKKAPANRRKPILFTENVGSSTEKTNESITTSTRNENVPKKRRSATADSHEIEYEYPSSTVTDPVTPSIVRLVPANIPPLSNFELKQIVEALVHHPKGHDLTLDEAQLFAIDRANEIVLDNHHYRIEKIAPEWFYDAILLRYPSLVFHFRSWFENVRTDCIPSETDLIELKQWQVALMLHAQIKTQQPNVTSQ